MRVCLCERERESKRQFACVSRVRTETERQCRPIYSTILNCNQYTVRTIKCLVNRLINSHLIITTKKNKNKKTPKTTKTPSASHTLFSLPSYPCSTLCANTLCVPKKTCLLHLTEQRTNVFLTLVFLTVWETLKLSMHPLSDR